MTSTGFTVGYEKTASRALQAPGGNSSDIFGANNTNDVRNGGHSSGSSASSDAGTPSCPSTPTPLNDHNGQDLSDSSAPSSASSSRRGSRQEDTKNRLFGADLDSPRRKVVDRMKSSIFGEPQANHVRSAKKHDHGVVRRNPITGEVYDEPDKVNGHGIGMNGKSNGVSSTNGSGSASLPSTPVRVRQPPGGKCSGIF